MIRVHTYQVPEIINVTGSINEKPFQSGVLTVLKRFEAHVSDELGIKEDLKDRLVNIQASLSVQNIAEFKAVAPYEYKAALIDSNGKELKCNIYLKDVHFNNAGIDADFIVNGKVEGFEKLMQEKYSTPIS